MLGTPALAPGRNSRETSQPMVDSFGNFHSYYGPRTQIIPGVWLGDADDAAVIRNSVSTNPNVFALVAVHEDHDSVAPKSHWVPIMTGDENKDPANYRA